MKNLYLEFSDVSPCYSVFTRNCLLQSWNENEYFIFQFFDSNKLLRRSDGTVDM